jgi:hypothetical protein
MKNVEIIHINLWDRNFILSFRSFHIYSWDLDIICDHGNHSWETAIIILVGIHSWDFNISDETSVSICERHLMMLVAA